MKLLIFDTETTSIRPGNICQLSYIIIDTSTKPQTTTGKNYFFTVEHVDDGAREVHGFSEEILYELSGGLEFMDLCHEFMKDFYDADFVIGHNVQFDIKFLTHEINSLWEAGLLEEQWQPKNTFCTMNYYKNICKIPNPNGNLKNPKLSEVVEYLNISEKDIIAKANELFEGSGNYHDARFDTAATYLTVINGLKTKLIPHGYFTELLKK